MHTQLQFTLVAQQITIKYVHDGQSLVCPRATCHTGFKPTAPFRGAYFVANILGRTKDWHTLHYPCYNLFHCGISCLVVWFISLKTRPALHKALTAYRVLLFHILCYLLQIIWYDFLLVWWHVVKLQEKKKVLLLKENLTCRSIFTKDSCLLKFQLWENDLWQLLH